jgi:hypothetical protein
LPPALPLRNYYFCIGEDDEDVGSHGPYVVITPRRLWDTRRCYSDNCERCDLLAERLGFLPLTDSVYELVGSPETSSALLQAAGAVENTTLLTDFHAQVHPVTGTVPPPGWVATPTPKAPPQARTYTPGQKLSSNLLKALLPNLITLVMGALANPGVRYKRLSKARVPETQNWLRVFINADETTPRQVVHVESNADDNMLVRCSVTWGPPVRPQRKEHFF